MPDITKPKNYCLEFSKNESSIGGGDQAIYTGNLKYLKPGTIGILKILNDKLCSITYPQNKAFEQINGNWVSIKNSPNQVYSHSCLLTEIKII